MAIQDKVANKASGTFENQDTRAATLSKTTTVAQGVLSRSGKGATAAAAAARNGRVFNDQLIGRRK
jgi:hypothetical protein